LSPVCRSYLLYTLWVQNWTSTWVCKTSLLKTQDIGCLDCIHKFMECFCFHV
jgi:hypothetical protein